MFSNQSLVKRKSENFSDTREKISASCATSSIACACKNNTVAHGDFFSCNAATTHDGA